MPSVAKKSVPGTVRSCTTVMRGQVEVKLGSILNFPYNIEVSAGEPSHWKWVHGKYHGQNCTVTGIEVTSRSRGKSKVDEDATFKVKFADGFEIEATSRAFIYIGPPVKK